MSKNPITDALQSLLPTYPDPLPARLINLSLSLLSQSRIRATALKAEEEIARPYACAHIACERLKISLDLPKPTQQPPCAPRIYKKLYTYLENALPMARQGRSTDACAATVPTTPTKPTTPSKMQTQSRTATPTTASKSSRPFLGMKGSKPPGADTFSEKRIGATMPTIRHLCKAFHRPRLAPHVLVGLEAVYDLAFSEQSSSTPKKRSSAAAQSNNSKADENPSEVDIKLLAAAILLTVLFKVEPPIDPTRSEAFITQQAEKAAEVLGMETEENKSRIHEWIIKITNEGWAEGKQWWENLPDKDAAANEDGDDILLGITEDEDDRTAGLKSKKRKRRRSGVAEGTERERGGLLPGLGTMMQDKVDFLSEQRRADYKKWKRGMMARLSMVERAGGANGVAA